MLISTAEYAAKHGVSPATISRYCSCGLLLTAQRVGRNWRVDSEEPYPFHSASGLDLSLSSKTIPAHPTPSTRNGSQRADQPLDEPALTSLDMLHRVDVLAECAHSLSMLPSSRKTIDSLFSVSPGKYFAASNSSPSKNHPALSRGRAEHEVCARRALGILSAGDLPTLHRLLRSANREAFDAISSAERVRLESLPISPSLSLNCHQLVVMLTACSVLQKPLEDSPALQHIANLLYSYAERITKSFACRDEDAIRAFEAAMGVKPSCSASEIYDLVSDSAREALNACALLANQECVSSDEYCADCALTPLDAHWLMLGSPSLQELATRTSYLLLLRGIRRDRDYAMTLYRESASSKTAQLADELDRQKNRCEGLEIREKASKQLAETLAARVQTLERENARLKRELEEHASDEQELVE